MSDGMILRTKEGVFRVLAIRDGVNYQRVGDGEMVRIKDGDRDVFHGSAASLIRLCIRSGRDGLDPVIAGCVVDEEDTKPAREE